MLDEIDKIGMDFRGDPSSALLEVLDPEQNNTFADNYLEVPFDLSKVLFIATGNLVDPIPMALRDRMEIIALPGYTQREKAEIGKRFLVPKQMENHGLKPKHVAITDEAMTTLVQSYTHEAGVRNLEREIANVMRKVARTVAEGRTTKTNVDHAQAQRAPRARRASSTASWSPRTRSARPPDSSSPRSAATSWPSRSPAWRARRTSSSPASWATSCASRRAPGSPGSAPTPRDWASSASSSRSTRCTSTCPPAPSPRTAPRPASPWSRPWSAR